ncbi:MAG: RNA polymerase sigma factor [Nannocystaceae bacterium]|nr:RNA polymerase sigma factor [Nannocystaceae bacterium]
MSSPEPSSPDALTPSVFAVRFRESSRVLWCAAAGVVGDRAQAEDMLQEAALIALGKLGSFRPGSNFVAWMSQYVRFVSLNQRRKLERRQRARHAEGQPAPPQVTDPPDPRALFDRNVAQALASLSEAQRTCLLLKTVVELEYTEIASLLEMPAGTAMSHVSRARAKMHKLLQPRPAVPGAAAPTSTAEVVQ